MPEKAHRSFTDLEIWKKAREFKKEIFLLVKDFPDTEKYRLSDQLIRSSRSINSCVAEGHGRFSYKEQIHFCILARGSMSETLNHLIDAFDCKYISAETLKNLKSKISELERLLNGYINYSKRACY